MSEPGRDDWLHCVPTYRNRRKGYCGRRISAPGFFQGIAHALVTMEYKSNSRFVACPECLDLIAGMIRRQAQRARDAIEASG